MTESMTQHPARRLSRRAAMRYGGALAAVIASERLLSPAVAQNTATPAAPADWAALDEIGRAHV